MSATLKYALRYAPLLILALLLIPLRVYTAGKGQPNPALLQHDQGLSPFSPGPALYSVTMLPSGEVWAVGGSFIGKCNAQNATRCFPTPASGIILHYSDSVWVPANVTDPLRAPLLSVSLDSPHDGWAVGWAGTLVHYHSNTWSIAPDSAKFKQNLLGVTMLSPSDGWAVGYSGTILHYDGKRWTRVPSLTTVDLRSIAMPSPQEGWAVGDSGTILHYHNGTWSLASSP